MKYILENDFIYVEIDSKWAELTRLLFGDLEILYQKHPDFWQRQSPVLFPIVGGLKNKKYFYKNQEFSLSQHGFARDQEFQLVEKSEKFLQFLLKSEKKFRDVYPFEFELYISYILSGKKITVEYEVRNQENNEMFFSIGGHPAFFIQGDISRYSLVFDKNMKYQIVDRISPTEFLLDENFREKFPISEKWDDTLVLQEDFFRVDAMIFRNVEINNIDFCRNDKKIFTFSFQNFPDLGIWKQPNSPFICLEPWAGYVDSIDATGNLAEKGGIIRLEKWENKKFSWSLDFS